MTTETIQRYPLAWPSGWRRTADGHIEIQLQPWAGVALVDFEDGHLLLGRHWYAHRQRRQIYVRADVWRDGKSHSCTMHRIVMSAQAGQIVDHRDGNGLDNRRSNLRIATNAQNSANRRVRGGRYSDFKGVTQDARRPHRWHAQITKDYRHYNIGTFDNELTAAAAYDIYALALHGEFAQTNLGLQLGVVR